MKKSDMVKALLEHNDELMPLQAEDIIDFLVSKGMLPPPHYGQALVGFYRIDDWEPEE